ncbi:MAG TPA: STAS domain-containing protein [Moraxellaceae bacterium]|nr:STAS domain-containing protein [Moraxellaceae bacterium]
MSLRLAVAGDVLRVEGVVGFDNADAACAEGITALASMPSVVTLDLAGLESATTVTVAVLLSWARSLSARGGRMQLAHVPEKCRAILGVSGLSAALSEVRPE